MRNYPLRDNSSLRSRMMVILFRASAATFLPFLTSIHVSAECTISASDAGDAAKAREYEQCMIDAQCPLAAKDVHDSQKMAAFIECSVRVGSEPIRRMHDAADLIDSRLAILHSMFDDKDDRQLDAKQAKWHAEIESKCPPMSNEAGAAMIASTCRAEPYEARARLLTAKMQTCANGSCSADDL